jgi:hypothetical protein
MSTQNQSYSDDDRVTREEIDDNDDNDDVTSEVVLEEDVIDTRGEEISARPLITPAAKDGDAVKAPSQSAPPAEGEKPPAALSAAPPLPNAGFETPNLPKHDSAKTSERWQQIQGEFVDDPRKAVGDAHQLVGELVQRIVDGFTHERGELEAQWSKGDSVSTEDLRVCLQHYREFFSRLLPSVNGMQHS